MQGLSWISVPMKSGELMHKALSKRKDELGVPLRFRIMPDPAVPNTFMLCPTDCEIDLGNMLYASFGCVVSAKKAAQQIEDDMAILDAAEGRAG